MKQIEKIKVGDRLYGFYYPMTGGIVVQEEHVQDIVLEDDGIIYETDDGFYSDKDFGRTLFMTKEEAEVGAVEMERRWREDLEELDYYDYGK